MGASQSSPTSQSVPKNALHVLRVAPNSPASESEIEPYFSFIVGYSSDSRQGEDGGFEENGLDATELEKIVEAHEGRVLLLHVWNAKYREFKMVPITPSRSWSSHSELHPHPHPPTQDVQPSLLGLSVRLCRPELAMDNVWHVLDVAEGSPAESAGLVPAGDYVLGWSGGVLSGEDDFYSLVEQHVDKPLRIYVYSYDFDAIREVVLVPNRQWGGEGLLGCVFGFGLLHRIPHRDPSAPSLPAELLNEEEDSGHQGQEIFVPAETLDSTMPYSPQPLSLGHQAPSIGQMMPRIGRHPILDELEEVGEVRQHTSSTSPVPPPPKSAAPPIQTPTPKRPQSLRSPLGNGMSRVFTPPGGTRQGSSTPMQRSGGEEDDRRSEGSMTSVD